MPLRDPPTKGWIIGGIVAGCGLWFVVLSILWFTVRHYLM